MYNWACLTIAYAHYATSVTVTLTTNNPCHLFMYWTDVEPVRHRSSRILRGLSIPWGSYFCFVAWNTIEQSEPGDTLIHTFIVPDWEYCQYRYFTFIGTVTGINSPSIAPLFKHHHSGVPPLQTEQQLIGIHYSVTYGGTAWGQRLFILNRLVSKLSFKLEKTGNPIGPLRFWIRKVSDGSLLSETTLEASISVPTTFDWIEATLATPILVNEEVRIMVSFLAGDVFNCVKVWGSIFDQKPNEYTTHRTSAGAYSDYPTRDFGYIYTYQQY